MAINLSLILELPVLELGKEFVFSLLEGLEVPVVQLLQFSSMFLLLGCQVVAEMVSGLSEELVEVIDLLLVLLFLLFERFLVTVGLGIVLLGLVVVELSELSLMGLRIVSLAHQVAPR